MHVALVGLRASLVERLADALSPKGVTVSEIHHGATLDEALRALENAQVLVADLDFASAATGFPAQKSLTVGYAIGYACARGKGLIGFGIRSDVPLIEESVYTVGTLEALEKAILSVPF